MKMSIFSIDYARFLLSEKIDRLLMNLAWKMPKRLVSWCAVRVWVNASTGKWSDEEVLGIRFVEALDRWVIDD